MEELVETVLEALPSVGLVEVETSARHVHLSQEDLEILFGKGAGLTPKRPLSQTGQFLAEERVNLIGTKGRKDGVAVLGPVRLDTQVELARSDCFALGVDAPLRESGDVAGSAAITLEGTCGKVTIRQGVIMAKNHVHLTPAVAKKLALVDKQRISVRVWTSRPITFHQVVVRVDPSFRCRVHLDVDEANAAMCSGFTLGKLVVNP